MGLVKYEKLARNPLILVPLGLKVLDYIEARDEKLYNKLFEEKREIIREYYFTPHFSE